jgi:signal peptidase I
MTGRSRHRSRFREIVSLVIPVLLALVAVGTILSLGTWPPIYAVESDSMQHGSGDHLGYLNAGDIVFALSVSNSSIRPYIDALKTGYHTYGEAGDVLIYHPNGQWGETVIIHRAILWLNWNSTSRAYSAPALSGLACPMINSSPCFSVESTNTRTNASARATTGLAYGDHLQLWNIGEGSASLSITIGPSLGDHSGYLTLGDNNSGAYDQRDRGDGVANISSLVEPGWIVGVARGMLPWFGAIPLSMVGDIGNVPLASWHALIATLVLLVAFAVVATYAVRRHKASVGHGRRIDEGILLKDGLVPGRSHYHDSGYIWAGATSQVGGAGARPNRASWSPGRPASASTPRAGATVPSGLRPWSPGTRADLTREEVRAAAPVAKQSDSRNGSELGAEAAWKGSTLRPVEAVPRPRYVPLTLWNPSPDSNSASQEPSSAAAHEDERRAHFASQPDHRRHPARRSNGPGSR